MLKRKRIEYAKRLKNIIFLLCLIPYVFFIVMCIKAAIFGYVKSDYREPDYGYIAIGEYASHVGGEILDFCFSPLNCCMFFLWIAYQIYFIITYEKKYKVAKDNEQNKKIEEDNKGNKVKKLGARRVIFFISIGCWAFYLLTSIGAIFFGTRTGGGLFESYREYGIEGMMSALVWNGLALTIIPVLPCSLIYIIIYIIVNRKKKNKICKEENKEECT